MLQKHRKINIKLKYMKDKCVICGKETPYDVSTHIDFRLNYIEGSGQLCGECAGTEKTIFTEVKQPNYILVEESKIKELSNNFELGNYVRTLYLKSKHD